MLASFKPALRRIAPLAAAAALLAGFSAPAAAGDMASLGSVGPWSLFANATLCEADASFENGTDLHFFINAKAELWIAVSRRGWSIPDGDYEVETRIDRTLRSKHQAKAVDNWIIWQIALGDHNINLLSFGRTLYLTLGRMDYQYDLVRSEAMLKALGRCAGDRMAASNPFAGPQSNPYQPAVSNPFTGR